MFLSTSRGIFPIVTVGNYKVVLKVSITLRGTKYNILSSY